MDKTFLDETEKMYNKVRVIMRKWAKRKKVNFQDCSFDALTPFNRQVSIEFMRWHKRKIGPAR